MVWSCPKRPKHLESTQRDKEQRIPLLCNISFLCELKLASIGHNTFSVSPLRQSTRRTRDITQSTSTPIANISTNLQFMFELLQFLLQLWIVCLHVQSSQLLVRAVGSPEARFAREWAIQGGISMSKVLENMHISSAEWQSVWKL